MKKPDLFETMVEADAKHLIESDGNQSEATCKQSGVYKTFVVAAVFLVFFGVVMFLLQLIPGNDKSPSGGSSDTTCSDTANTQGEKTSPSVYTAELPTEADVLEAYTKAMEASNWFRLTTHGLTVDGSDSVVIDGMPYYRCTRFESYDEFIEYMDSLFNQKVINMLLHSSIGFKEYDGKLYITPADSGSNICIGGTTAAVNRVSDNHIEIVVTVDINDFADRTNPSPKGKVIGQTEVVFPYELIQGKWVFTDFPDIDGVNTDGFIGAALETSPELYQYFECGGMTLILPKRYEGKYSVVTNSPEALGLIKPAENRSEAAFYDENMLFEVYYNIPETQLYGERFFQMYRIVRYSAGEYERNVLASITTRRDVLGFDGEYYYVMHYPSDGIANPADSEFYSAVNSCSEAARLLFGKYNNLTKVSPTEFYIKTYTYEGEHKYFRFYPYGTSKADFYHTFVLSQPADKGADGIWCVERWYAQGTDETNGFIKPVFPESGDISAVDFYANLQMKVTSGEATEKNKFIDPAPVAVTFAREVLGYGFADASYFTEAGGLPGGEWIY